jgi:hypothetical protein
VEKVVLNSDANIKKNRSTEKCYIMLSASGRTGLDLSDPAAYNRLTFVGTVLAKDLY